MSNSPTTWDLIRPYDPVLRRLVPVKRAVEYMSRRDKSILELPDDARPTVFRCRALSRAQRDTLDLVQSAKHRYKLAFRLSLIEVIDIDAGGGKYNRFKPARPELEEPLDDAAIDTLEAHGFGDRDILDIGSAVEELSTVGKGVPPSCPRLDSSLRAWDSQSSSRRAERKTDDETPPE